MTRLFLDNGKPVYVYVSTVKMELFPHMLLSLALSFLTSEKLCPVISLFSLILTEIELFHDVLCEDFKIPASCI